MAGKPLDPRTVRACARRMKVRFDEARKNDEMRVNRESMYWLGATEAFRSARLQLLELARAIERKQDQGE